MYRQGAGGVADEALCLARPFGFPIGGVTVPVRIWHGAQDQVVPVGMGRYLARHISDAVATFFPNEGHHFVYERWREILGVLVTEARGHARVLAAGQPADVEALEEDVPTRTRPAPASS
jgi:pimeloyl-ACP methyl ester carboxylesterase